MRNPDRGRDPTELKKLWQDVASLKQSVYKDKSNSRLFDAKARELESELTEIRYHLHSHCRLKARGVLSEFYDIILNWMILEKRKEENKLESSIKHYRFLAQVCKGKQTLDETALEAARGHPIGEIMPKSPENKSGRSVVYNCPLHNEKTGSFHWFKADNHWYCFGCNEGGDVIDLYRRIYQVGFVEAVKFLSQVN